MTGGFAAHTAVVPAKAGHPNLSPPFCGERSDRGGDANASARDPGEGRGTAAIAIAGLSDRTVFRIVGKFSPHGDRTSVNWCDRSASPLTRSLRCASASTSPRKGRGEVKEAGRRDDVEGFA